ncbi:MAG: hypothetical protein JRF56_20990 [Deltaproteobacteria bacterium]|nr:hypothetical protein [Deltaproteobacteria bacterium]
MAGRQNSGIVQTISSSKNSCDIQIAFAVNGDFGHSCLDLTDLNIEFRITDSNVEQYGALRAKLNLDAGTFSAGNELGSDCITLTAEFRNRFFNDFTKGCPRSGS